MNGLRANRMAYPCVVVLAMAAVATTSWAAGQGLSSAQASYQQERAHCLRGESPQDLATCLKEAGAASDEARRGASEAARPAAELERNATQRCEVQPAADRAACVQRVLGGAAVQGSVEAGGLLRQAESKQQ